MLLIAHNFIFQTSSNSFGDGSEEMSNEKKIIEKNFVACVNHQAKEILEQNSNKWELQT